MSCRRCGKCCQYQLSDGITKTCEYLVGEINIFTTCLIYENRLGTIIAKEILKKNIMPGKDLTQSIVCRLRTDNKIKIEGCTEL